MASSGCRQPTGKMTARFVQATVVVGIIYLGLIGLTGFQMSKMATGFIPDQDIGYQAVIVFLPPGASPGSHRCGHSRSQRHHPENRGKAQSFVTRAGFDVTTSTIAPNVGTIFYGLPSLYGKHVPGVTAATMLPKVRAALAELKTPSSS